MYLAYFGSIDQSLPLLRRSVAVLLPEYVGLMSRPMSSMTASSSAYLLCGATVRLVNDKTAKIIQKTQFTPGPSKASTSC